jgi:hypothetical protein
LLFIYLFIYFRTGTPEVLHKKKKKSRTAQHWNIHYYIQSNPIGVKAQESLNYREREINRLPSSSSSSFFVVLCKIFAFGVCTYFSLPTTNISSNISTNI